MLVKEELTKLRGGDEAALETLFKDYSHQIYREALIKNNGNQKAAAKAVLDTFYNINAIAKNGSAEDNEAVVSVLNRAQQEQKIEDLCLNTVWRSLSGMISSEEQNDTAISDSNTWINGRKMETVSEHVATVHEASQSSAETTVLNNAANGQAADPQEEVSRLLLQDYPDDVIEGVEMEAKRKKMSKWNIVMLVIICILILFLVWSLLGIILAITPSTSHINIGFGPFINGIRRLIGW